MNPRFNIGEYRRFLVAILGLMSLITLMGSVMAGGIVGISPGNINYKDVLRGGFAERFVTITIDSEEPVGVKATPRGEIGEWLEFPDNLTVSRNSPVRMPIAVKPPVDIPNGNYSGFLRISTESLGDGGIEGHAVSTIRAVLDVSITVEVTDHEILQCRASGFQVHSAEKGDDVQVNINILNEGNVRLKPDVVFDIWDQDQISIVKTESFIGDMILPTREEKASFFFGTDDLDLDQYWIDINVPDCFTSETLTFDVLEVGALKADGLLVNIFSKVWAEVDSTFPIVANFKNIGEKSVDARFKGQITKDGKIIQLMESEESTVGIGENSNFTFFFTPEKPGKYIASGRVFYDKKRTFESSTVINVTARKFGVKQAILTVVYLAIMLFILVLFFKIRKEKKRYRERIRGMRNGM